MKIKSNDSLLNDLNVFSNTLPTPVMLFFILVVISIAVGVASVGLINFKSLGGATSYITVAGLLTGLLVIMLPTLLTVLVIKSLRRYVMLRYLLFISLFCAIIYSVFVLLGSAIYSIVGNYSLASTIILVGDASIFGVWFFVSKVVLRVKKQAIIFSLVQPTLNILLYIPSSTFLFSFTYPLKILFLKLYAGIFIFVIISYVILYILDNPMKRNLGLGSVEVLSQMVDDWLFNVDVAVGKPLGDKFGVSADVDASTIVFKKGDKSIKAIMFAPWLHYGPVGSIGGSNFPYLLEKHAMLKYGATAFIMHSAVNEDFNPVSSAQFTQVRNALDLGVTESRKIRQNTVSLSTNSHNDATVTLLTLGNIDIATFTRAPKVTEDVSPEASALLKGMLSTEGRELLLIDAHNSRFESAPADELLGVQSNSKPLADYISAIKGLGKPDHKNAKVRIGVASTDIYGELGGPLDLAYGNLNVIVFAFNGVKHAMIQFNANNMLPTIRTEIVKHIKKKYKISCEVYTTDTHFVNSLEKNASNVLGRYTSPAKLVALADSAVKEALSNIENVDVYYKKEIIKKFLVWGPDVREKALAVVKSVLGIARMLIPIITAGGFIIAVWLISYV